MTKKFIGWSAMGLFVAAVATLAIPIVLILSPSLEATMPLETQAFIVTSGVLALLSAVVGLFAFQTSSGKVGVVGGLALVIAVAILLSFTTIAHVNQGGAQSQPALSEVESHQ